MHGLAYTASAGLTASTFTPLVASRRVARRVMAPRSGAARASLEPEVADSVILNISSVIKFGAPMFNKGDAEGCSKLYKQTAMNIVRDAAVTSEEIKATLREAVAKSESIVAETGDHQKSAWALRRGLDTVVDLILEPPSDEPMLFKATKESAADEEEEEEAQDPTGASTPVVNEAALFDFAASPQMASRWRSLNDGIMGGVSDGAMLPSMDDACARFTGVVRTENNGGFASVRASFGSGIDLSQFEGFYLDVKPGDDSTAGKAFLLVVKDEECMTTQVNFKAPFACADGDGDGDGWGRVKVPFAAFDRPERMGRAVMRGPLRADAVCEIGLMVLKGGAEQVGPFNLDVRAVGAYK